MKLMLGALALSAMLAGCVLLSPPESGPPAAPAGAAHPRERAMPPPPAPAGQPSPWQQTPEQPPPAPPMQRRYTLGAAATALVGEARAQERNRDFGLAAQTLERALGIEPRNPLVWIELGRENILAGDPAEAYGMGRKALYLAGGDPHAEARAWQVIAASLRAQGRNDAAYTAEEKAAALDPN
jgi:tetratricopeptide (TPR) repeat protein